MAAAVKAVLMCVATLVAASEAFTPAALPMLRGSRMGAVSCRSGVRGAACSLDMAAAQSVLIAAAKVAVEVAEDADEVVEEVVQKSTPAISIVGQTIGGNILLVVPILGAVVIFSVIAYILTQTFFVPPGVVNDLVVTIGNVHLRPDKGANEDQEATE